MTPVRLQLSRRKGFDLQAHSRAVNGLPAVNVARPSKWGNPIRLMPTGNLEEDNRQRVRTVAFYGQWLRRRTLQPSLIGEPPSITDIIAHLRSRNLACWCSPGPCHADHLLSIANVPAGRLLCEPSP